MLFISFFLPLFWDALYIFQVKYDFFLKLRLKTNYSVENEIFLGKIRHFLRQQRFSLIREDAFKAEGFYIYRWPRRERQRAIPLVS